MLRPDASPLEIALADTADRPGLHCVALTQVEHWNGDERRPLRALFSAGLGARALVLTDDVAAAEALPATVTPAEAAARLGVPLLDATAPVPLLPHVEPKPWGDELWFTGIERRGVSAVGAAASGEPGAGSDHGTVHAAVDRGVPLPWLLTALPRRFGAVTAPVLLKILAPHADARIGDLYFEMHEEKQEVYVVTRVDPDAWPDGRGAIRMGFDPDQLAALGDRDLRAAFGAAVADYEIVRRDIDALLDARREAAGLAPDALIDPERMGAWLAEVPEALRREEARRREDVLGLTALAPLRVGDVVRVPRRVPHALQHGVRVVEFQTPVYERRILWFGQKVLTQDHWDTAEALPRMHLRPPSMTPMPLAVEDAGARAEWIVDFDDFRVLRVRLEAGARCPLPQASHGVLMGVQGTPALGGHAPGPEQAALVPGSALEAGLHGGREGGVALLAIPSTIAPEPRP